jgi:hypothetical protein
MTTPELHQAWARLVDSWKYRPYVTTFAVGLIPVGVLAILFGDKVSAALGNLAANTISRGMGFALFTGGLITLLGILSHRTLSVTLGMSLMALGLGIYGVGVVLGLGLAGMVAGPIALIATIATIRQVVTLAQIAEVSGDR